MATAKGRNKFMFDADASITLRALTDGAETVTATEAGVALGTLTQAYWDANEIPLDSRNGGEVVIQVTALDKVNADETYVLSLEVADEDTFVTNLTEIASVAVTKTGIFSLNVDPENIAQLSAGAPTHIRIKATLGGTTPSITYAAWLN